MSELCRLHGVWFLLDSAGQREAAVRLHGLLERLGADPAPAVRAVLRLLLALADRRLGQPPPQPPLGRFGARVTEQVGEALRRGTVLPGRAGRELGRGWGGWDWISWGAG